MGENEFVEANVSTGEGRSFTTFAPLETVTQSFVGGAGIASGEWETWTKMSTAGVGFVTDGTGT